MTLNSKPKKLHYVPFNMFFCISSFLLPMVVLSFIPIDLWESVAISLYIYLKDVQYESQNDYLEAKIKKLEDGNT